MTSTDNENLVNQTNSGNKNIPIYNAASSSSHQHSHSCCDSSHHHHQHYPSFFDHNDEHLSSKNDMLVKRKTKKNSKQDVTRAELIPGHQGDKNIDDLVNFINGPSKSTTNKKSKK